MSIVYLCLFHDSKLLALNEPYVLTHLQNRNKVMEVCNEQSLKTVQQHFSTLNTELTKYRSAATLASTFSCSVVLTLLL